ncbi:ABC transporter substrate-binding protein [Rhodobacteraceae bacterium F11138]|nr:ABC transporter substrate-binding protein [Rhodobacteraceae bacterium F11138]
MKSVLFASAVAMSILGSVPATAGKSDSTLTVALKEEFPNFDGYINASRDGLVLTRHIYDMLIYRDPATFDYKPLLATEWNQVDDLTWEFKLREGVTFHDGSAFTADDVVFTLEKYGDPETGTRYMSSIDWIDRVEKVDDYTVRIITKTPFPVALEYIANSLPIYPSDYYQEVGMEEFGQKPVGTGPYRIESSSGNELLLKAHADYYEGGGKGTPAIETLKIRTIPDVATQIAEVIGGSVDWMWNLPADQVPQLQAVPTLKVELGSTMRIAMILIDAAARKNPDSPLADLRVRQALNHAIDRDTIVKALVGGDGVRLDVPCYPAQFGCETDAAVVYDYDPDKARALLKEAGYADGLSFEMSSYRDRPRAEAVQSYLSEIGVSADLEMLQARASFSAWREAKIDLWYGDAGSFSIGDADASIGNFFNGSTNDGFGDEEVNELISEAAATTDQEKRKQLYSDAIRLITERAYWVPMHTVVMGYAYNKGLEFTPSVDELPRFFHTKWK